MTLQDHLVNPELIKVARQTMGGFNKRAFVPGGDMSGGGGGGGAPPGGDPAAGGMPPGGDPAAGGMPPGDPSGGGGGGGGGGGMDPAMIQQMVQQAVQQAMMSQGGGAGGAGAGGAGGAGGALKPKVDVNSVLLQILKIQARIADQLGVKIPASEMVVTQQDQMGLAQATQSGQPMPGMDPSAGGGGGGGAGGGAIPPVQGMEGMQPAGAPPGGEMKQGSYRANGSAFDSGGFGEISNKASAIARIRKMSRAE